MEAIAGVAKKMLSAGYIKQAWILLPRRRHQKWKLSVAVKSWKW